ncbi:MAG: P-II family nitrogen regulator [Desulfovibrio sp.]|nr:P-II family nitrogen regulator [Desulfovibrio sp.]
MPNENQLLISVVRRGRGERVIELTREAGATGNTTVFGTGTSQSTFWRMLCLGDMDKEIVFTVASETVMPRIKEALRMAPDLCVKMPGVGIVLNLETFYHFNSKDASSPHMTDDSSVSPAGSMTRKIERSLLFIVVNAGLAEDIIDVARDAGATGGTVLKARGTAREKDDSFFGITVVPEKEILLILVLKEQEEKISRAIRESEVLDQPGVGIMFSVPADDFFPLGLKDNSK